MADSFYVHMDYCVQPRTGAGLAYLSSSMINAIKERLKTVFESFDLEFDGQVYRCKLEYAGVPYGTGIGEVAPYENYDLTVSLSSRTEDKPPTGVSAYLAQKTISAAGDEEIKGAMIDEAPDRLHFCLTKGRLMVAFSALLEIGSGRAIIPKPTFGDPIADRHGCETLTDYAQLVGELKGAWSEFVSVECLWRENGSLEVRFEA